MRKASAAVFIVGICTLVVAAGEVAALTTGRYKEKPVPSTSRLYDASCPSRGRCFVIGSSKESAAKPRTGVVAKFGGKVGKLTRVKGTVALSELACAQSSFCMAVGQSTSNTSPGALVPIVKGKPGKVQIFKDYLIGVGCGPKRSCWITGVNPNNGKAVIVHTVGAKVRKVSQLKESFSFGAGEGASPPAPICRSASKCFGVGTENFSKGPAVIYSLVNGKLASQKKVSQASAFTGITCASINNCLVTGVKPTSGGKFAGIIMRLKNGNPGPVKVVKGTNYIGALACRTSTQCWAFGGSGKESEVIPITSKIGKAIKLAAPVQAATCGPSRCLGVGTRGTYPKPTSGFTLRLF